MSSNRHQPQRSRHHGCHSGAVPADSKTVKGPAFWKSRMFLFMNMFATRCTKLGLQQFQFRRRTKGIFGSQIWQSDARPCPAVCSWCLTLRIMTWAACLMRHACAPSPSPRSRAWHSRWGRAAGHLLHAAAWMSKYFWAGSDEAAMHSLKSAPN